MASVHKITRSNGTVTSWRVRWRDSNGKMRSRNFPKSRQAKDFAAQVEADKYRGQEIKPEGAKTTMKAYAERYGTHLGTDWRPTTQGVHNSHMLHIRQHLGDLYLTQVTRTELLNMRAAMLRNGLSPAYVRAVLLRVSSILSAAMDEQLISANPARGMKWGKAKDRADVAVALTREQYQGLLAALQQPWKRYAQLIAITGLRPSEAAGLTWDRISEQGIKIDRQLIKGDQGRPVFGPLKTADSKRTIPTPSAILEWDRPSEGGLVFIGRQRGPLVRSTRQSAWSNVREKLDLPPAARGWHTLRHTYVSHAIAAGVPLTNISAQIGHKDVGVTMATYSHMIEGTDAQYANTVADVLG
jgi:integrase